MSQEIKEYAIYPGQIKINNEIFFGLDYKLTDFYNKLAEEKKQLKSQLQQKENIIKEVREYIKDRTEFGEYTHAYPGVLNQDEVRQINRILDKENKQ